MTITLLHPVLSANTLIGEPVKNPEGEDLGRIKELMIDTGSGRIAYAVLSFGGFLGFGDKLFAIPWDKLQIDPQDECFVLHVSKKTLESADGFDPDNWPDMTDQTWAHRTHLHFGVTPYWS